MDDGDRRLSVADQDLTDGAPHQAREPVMPAGADDEQIGTNLASNVQQDAGGPETLHRPAPDGHLRIPFLPAGDHLRKGSLGGLLQLNLRPVRVVSPFGTGARCVEPG